MKKALRNPNIYPHYKKINSAVLKTMSKLHFQIIWLAGQIPGMKWGTELLLGVTEEGDDPSIEGGGWEAEGHCRQDVREGISALFQGTKGGRSTWGLLQARAELLFNYLQFVEQYDFLRGELNLKKARRLLLWDVGLSIWLRMKCNWRVSMFTL